MSDTATYLGHSLCVNTRAMTLLRHLERLMRFFVGTSGYSYKEWKGIFYPNKLPQKEMLSYYASRFLAVEINSTFYGMPDESIVESWTQQTPDSFRFVLKAPQSITHRKRLNNAEVETEHLLRIASMLKGRQGPLLFQLPPNFKKDVSRLETFLGLIEKRASSAFEFRHESWFDKEVFDCLRANSCALCVAEVDDVPSADLVSTARWGYVRLRRKDYSDEQLSEWIERLRSQDWEEAYVFFKHEDSGTGPKLATRFLELARQ
jgi:uncharacterized protein YecE (DUF72 family)